MQLILAIASARTFNLSCNGVFSESWRKAASQSLVKQRKCERSDNRTHRDTAMKALGPNRNNDVGANPFKHLTSANDKAVRVSEQLQTRGVSLPLRCDDTIAVSKKSIGVKVHEPFVSKRDTFFVGELLDRIRLSRRIGLIAPHVMTRKEDTIARNNLAWLEQCHITNNHLVHVDLSLSTVTNDFDRTLFFLLIEHLKLPLLLPVVQRTSTHDDENSGDDGNTFNPIHRGLPCGADCAKVLEKTKGKRYHGGDR